MYELTVLVCWRVLETPVPGVAADRVKGIDAQRVGEFLQRVVAALNGMLATVPASSRRPKVWSRNWPQVKPHWDTPFSENRFWWTSLKMRLLTDRELGPDTGALRPSA